MKRYIGKILIFTCILVIGVLITGSIYQHIGVRKDSEAFVPVGELVDVRGKRMHVYSEGAGDATVVFAAGWGTVMPFADFYPLYDKLSSSAKIVVYDRFGSGFSDQTDEKRDIDTIVEEIHMALGNAGHKPPYVFVGHSLGALETVRFAQKYPDEVKAMVMLDGGTPEAYARMPRATAVSYFQSFMIRTGLARMLAHGDRFIDGVNSERNALRLLPEPLRELDTKAALLLGANRTIRDEMRQSKRNAEKIIADKSTLQIPLVAMSAGLARTEWQDSQKGWESWSTKAKLLTIGDAGHYIHQYEPELVAEQILNLVKGR